MIGTLLDYICKFTNKRLKLDRCYVSISRRDLKRIDMLIDKLSRTFHSDESELLVLEWFHLYGIYMNLVIENDLDCNTKKSAAHSDEARPE